MRLDVRTKLFVVLTATFVTALLVGDIIGGKLFELEILGTTFTVSVGMIPFPIVFLLTDTLNEFYGQKAARFVTLVGAAMASLTIVFLVVAGSVGWAGFTRGAEWTGFTEESWDRVFASSTRILIASVVAYLFSQLVDIAVFHLLKRATHNRYLWLRATGSTVVSQVFDTVAINFLAFAGKMPSEAIWKQIGFAYLIKLTAALALTPLIYAMHALVERVFHIDPVQLDDPRI